MAQTATEKMLQAASDEADVRAGDTVEADVDLSWVHETQLSIFKEVFEELGGEVWDRSKAILMIDHYPNPVSEEQASSLELIRDYAEQKGMDIVNVGIKHQAWRMLGLARPGAIMAGPDSHTPTAGALGAFAVPVGPTDTAAIWHTGQLWLTVPETIQFEITGELDDHVTPRDVGFRILERFASEDEYFAENSTVEYHGETIRRMGLDGRHTLCNMSTEMGATTSYIEPDDRLRTEYLDVKVDEEYEVYETDANAPVSGRHEIDAADLSPKVAFPESPSNVHDVGEAAGVEVDMFFLGSCANGHLSDLADAAELLEGEEVPPDLELIVTPATDEIRKQAAREGILDVFFEAGARVSSNTCSVCPGYEGVLGAGQTGLSTSTRNYPGRIGHRDAEVYLCSPKTLAASAIHGEITDPAEVA